MAARVDNDPTVREGDNRRLPVEDDLSAKDIGVKAPSAGSVS
jgi:hypothetical protein